MPQVAGAASSAERSNLRDITENNEAAAGSPAATPTLADQSALRVVR
ncbi:MAG: hypothetical protein ACRYGR_09930 [Janthinobacterium lividum]